MSYTVQISRPAEKFLRGLTDKKLYLRLREEIGALESDPRPAGCVKLQGVEELYRVRVGVTGSSIKSRTGFSSS